MLFDEILGQDGPLSTLRRSLEHGRLAQAYLFDGQSGVGKQKTAIALAAAVLCPNDPMGCGTCQQCRRISEGNHPDVRIFEPRKEGNRNLPVEFVREQILPFTRFAPFEAEAAFIIFPQADVSFPTLHAEAANTLLKTLEEPRKNLHFFLLSERPDRLLSTIRSRCQRIRFNRLSPDILQTILKKKGISEFTGSCAIALADGRADRALVLCEQEKAEKLLENALQIDSIVKQGTPGPLLDLAETLARNEDLSLTLEALALLYRDITAATLGLSSDHFSFNHQGNKIRERAHGMTVQGAAQRVEVIYQTCEDLERNANVELCIDAMLFALGSTV